MERITLSHGSGGQLMHDLIRGLFLKELKNPFLSELDDAAILDNRDKQKGEIVFTTDSYVVNPIFFPGGDIGKLSIYGTVNDLAVCGARPLYISVGMIIEEGLEMDILKRVVLSMKKAIAKARVNVVTGDVKVVEKGYCDKLFITTSGIGIKNRCLNLGLKNVEIGDQIIVTGPIAQHGVAILISREKLDIVSNVKSDCDVVNDMLSGIIARPIGLKFMRDPTRGGLATTLNEFVEDRNFGIIIDEYKIPISKGVRSTCELLGFDPLYMANEGRVVIIASKRYACNILTRLRRHPQGRNSAIIGEIVKSPKGKVCLRTKAGGMRLLRMLTGEQLPRIC